MSDKNSTPKQSTNDAIEVRHSLGTSTVSRPQRTPAPPQPKPEKK